MSLLVIPAALTFVRSPPLPRCVRADGFRCDCMTHGHSVGQ